MKSSNTENIETTTSFRDIIDQNSMMIPFKATTILHV